MATPRAELRRGRTLLRGLRVDRAAEARVLRAGRATRRQALAVGGSRDSSMAAASTTTSWRLAPLLLLRTRCGGADDATADDDGEDELLQGGASTEASHGVAVSIPVVNVNVRQQPCKKVSLMTHASNPRSNQDRLNERSG